MEFLKEGGNAVEGASRINQANVEETLNDINERILSDLGVRIPESARSLGSTGKRNPDGNSGDIDLAVDVDAVMENAGVDEDNVGAFIASKCEKYTDQVVNNTGTGIVSCGWDIVNTDGKQEGEIVQLDFMLVKKENLDFTEFAFWSPHQSDSEFKGAHRNDLLFSIAKNAKFNVIEKALNKEGIEVPATWERLFFDLRKGLLQGKQSVLSKKGAIVKKKTTSDKKLISNNKDEIVKMLLGPSAMESDVNSFETIMDFILNKDFIHKDKTEQILKDAADEMEKKFGDIPKILKNQLNEGKKMLRESKTDASKGVSHLEFLEDQIVSRGVAGADAGIASVRNFLNQIKQQGDGQDGTVRLSRKIDGFPGLYFGKTPDGKFFVSNKSFNNKSPKLGRSVKEIHELWNSGVAETHTLAYNALKDAFRSLPNGLVLHSDLLFNSKNDPKRGDMEIDGMNYHAFRPNTVIYGVPEDNKELYKRVKKARFGTAIHGAFEIWEDENGQITNQTRNRIEDIDQVIEFANNVQDNSKGRVFAPHVFVNSLDPLQKNVDRVEEIEGIMDSVEELKGEIDPEFNMDWEAGDDLFIKRVKKELVDFINRQVDAVGAVETIFTPDNENQFIKVFKKNVESFLAEKGNVLAREKKTQAGAEAVNKRFKEMRDWIKGNDGIVPMFKIFFRMQQVKQLLISFFDTLEDELSNAFINVDRDGDRKIEASSGEGFVLFDSPNMVKLVDRVTFTNANRKKDKGELFGEETESPKGKKPKSLKDMVKEDVFNKISAMENKRGFVDADILEQEQNLKNYNALYVGKFHPPTRAHLQAIEHLASAFGVVNVLVSEKEDKVEMNVGGEKSKVAGLPNELRVKILQDASPENVNVVAGPTSFAFGLTDPDTLVKMKQHFDLEEDSTVVLAIGNEGSRFSRMVESNAGKKMFIAFDPNNPSMAEEPSEAKSVGLYGIPLTGDSGAVVDEDDKLSASDARNKIASGDIEDAKAIMIGGESEKDDVVQHFAQNLQEECEEILDQGTMTDFIFEILGE